MARNETEDLSKLSWEIPHSALDSYRGRRYAHSARGTIFPQTERHMKRRFTPVSGATKVGFSTHGAALGEKGRQEAMTKFEKGIAVALIEVGNTGVDPAWIGMYLSRMGEAIGFDGVAVVADVYANEADMPKLNPEIAALGGNQTGMMAAKLEEVLRGLSTGGKTHRIATDAEQLEELFAGMPVLGGNKKKPTIN